MQTTHTHFFFSSTNNTIIQERSSKRHLLRYNKEVRSNVREQTMKTNEVPVCTHLWLPTHHEYRKPILPGSGPRTAALREENRGQVGPAPGRVLLSPSDRKCST